MIPCISAVGGLPGGIEHHFIKAGNDNVWVCKTCELVVNEEPPTVQSKRGSGAYLYTGLSTKKFAKEDKISIITYNVDVLWNAAEKKLFRKYRASHILTYNTKTNKLYRIYKRKGDKRKWQIRDISYNAWNWEAALSDYSRFDSNLVAARGNRGVANILKLIGNDITTKTRIARMVRGGKCMDEMRLGSDDLKVVMTRRDDEARLIAYCASTGWGSAGIKAIRSHTGSVCEKMDRLNAIPEFPYLNGRIYGTEEQLGTIAARLMVGDQRLSSIISNLSRLPHKIHYTRLNSDLDGLAFYVRAHSEYGDRELMIILSKLLAENGLRVMVHKTNNSMTLFRKDGMYVVMPLVPNTTVSKDDGTAAKVNINDPESIGSIVEFIKGDEDVRERKELRTIPKGRAKARRRVRKAVGSKAVRGV